jgi:putative inorganic carbon (hco3(-)) transporter
MIKQLWIWSLLIIYIVANSFLFANNIYGLLLVPALFIVFYYGCFSIKKLFLFTIFTVPLSVPLENIFPDLGFNLQLPTEILLIFFLFIFIFKLVSGPNFDSRIFKHPVSIAIYFYLSWMFITCITSSMPLVSFKFLISHIWFFASFYFLAAHFFKNKKFIRQYIWAYIISFIFIMIWAICRMYSKGYLDQYIAQRSALPFYKDHTSYGAIIAMILPFTVGFTFYKKYSFNFRLFCFFLSILTILALILSYTRAAWISTGIAFLAFLIFRFRIKLIYVAAVGILIFTAYYSHRTAIKLSMEQNHQDSSKELTKHLQSIYNIKSDASNMERINRWNSAFRMFNEKPVFGWGPGTYMFKYAPFQVYKDKTVISTNRGDWGNAHSEFIGPLAESGLLGTIFFAILIITILFTAFRRYSTLKNKNTSLILLCATLSLISYIVHGFLNNFLDTDKATALFWGFTAIIVAIDIYHSKQSEAIPQN